MQFRPAVKPRTSIKSFESIISEISQYNPSGKLLIRRNNAQVNGGVSNDVDMKLDSNGNKIYSVNKQLKYIIGSNFAIDCSTKTIYYDKLNISFKINLDEYLENGNIHSEVCSESKLIHGNLSEIIYTDDEYNKITKKYINNYDGKTVLQDILYEKVNDNNDVIKAKIINVASGVVLEGKTDKDGYFNNKVLYYSDGKKNYHECYMDNKNIINKGNFEKAWILNFDSGEEECYIDKNNVESPDTLIYKLSMHGYFSEADNQPILVQGICKDTIFNNESDETPSLEVIDRIFKDYKTLDIKPKKALKIILQSCEQFFSAGDTRAIISMAPKDIDVIIEYSGDKKNKSHSWLTVNNHLVAADFGEKSTELTIYKQPEKIVFAANRAKSARYISHDNNDNYITQTDKNTGRAFSIKNFNFNDRMMEVMSFKKSTQNHYR